MKIFDCHIHIENGLQAYDLDEVVKRNVIFNIVESYNKNAASVPKGDTISLIFDYKHNLSTVMNEIKGGKVNALKIHSRQQKIKHSDYPEITTLLAKTPDSLPVIVDAFYYGDEMEYMPSLEYIVHWAKVFPKRKIIVAHSGGYELLKYFFHLRSFTNVYYDLSFSLQYLADSSVYADMVKLVKFTDKQRIMFGSDYHWASPKLQLEVLQGIFHKLALSDTEKEMILYSNAESVFGR